MSNIVIECRQKSARSVTSNGDYEILLDKAIEILPGDQLVVQNCFLDTTVIDPSKIELKEDVNVKMNHVMYSRWMDMSNKTGSSAAAVNKSSLAVYSQARANMGTNIINPSYQLAIFVDFVAADTTKSFGGCTLTFTYVSGAEIQTTTGYRDEPAPYQLRVPETESYGTYRHTMRVLTKAASFELSSHTADELKAQFNCKLAVDGGVAYAPLTNTDKFVVPRTFEKTFTITKGLWDPDDLCSYMNEQCTRINTETFSASNNAAMLPEPYTFLKPSDVSPVNNKGNYNVLATTNGGGFYYIGTSLTTGGGYAIGSSQIEFAYDPNTRKMKLNTIHMPLYDSGGNISVVPTASSSVWHVASSSGGVRFINLEPAIFFEQKLGFDLSIICAPIEYDTIATTVTAPGIVPWLNPPLLPGSYFMPALDLTVGTNVTSAYVGIDIGVKKIASTAPSLTTFPAGGAIGSYIVVGTDTEPVIGTYTINNIGISSGYFVVEVDCLFKSRFIGMDAYSGSIRSIVSRYYTANNYTSSDSDSIVYENRGTPALLSELKIRILNPDQSLITNLGEDNTVFLRLLKRGMPPAIVNAKKKK